MSFVDILKDGVRHEDWYVVFDDVDYINRGWINRNRNLIKDNVIERDLWIKPGTQVGGFAAANEAIGTLILKFESQEKIEEIQPWNVF